MTAEELASWIVVPLAAAFLGSWLGARWAFRHARAERLLDRRLQWLEAVTEEVEERVDAIVRVHRTPAFSEWLHGQDEWALNHAQRAALLRLPVDHSFYELRNNLGRLQHYVFTRHDWPQDPTSEVGNEKAEAVMMKLMLLRTRLRDLTARELGHPQTWLRRLTLLSLRTPGLRSAHRRFNQWRFKRMRNAALAIRKREAPAANQSPPD
jgi:hypothetical protein